ncbi:hypothetical protein OE88DRAFT_1646232 [Heliocybe sulcata]|uniref:F-box domain-containing protein n=1 Tax=Heliocybe sulcata TaxID=5364 RepID=A0A5C3MYD9_9AGAM|nr:hypothetical protein OE88DRAFT_1646232 [Heliocybe sulcata]
MPPIHNLPTELLSEIFLYYIRACAFNGVPYEWLQLMLVCRLWKDTFKSPEFWTECAIGRNSDALLVALERSGRRMISIDGSLTWPPYTLQTVADHVLLIQSHQHRIRSLNLVITGVLMRTWRTQMTQLESLSLQNKPWAWETAKLTQFLSPTLQKLELKCFTWTAVEPLLVGNLQELTLVKGSLEPIRMEELLAALAKMPSLRRLRIDWDQTDPVNDLARVALPRLESISGCVYQPQELYYLLFVDAPAIRHARFSFRPPVICSLQTALSCMEDILSVIAKNCDLHTARFYPPNDEELHVTFSNVLPRPEVLSKGIHLEFATKPHQAFSILTGEMGDLFETIHVYEGGAVWDCADWRSVAMGHNMCNVRELHLQGSAVKLLPYGLDHLSFSGRYPRIFESLELLSLDDPALIPHERALDKSTKTEFIHHLIESLEHHSRAHQNDPTSTIGSQFCVIFKKGWEMEAEDMEVMRGLGANVTREVEEDSSEHALRP